MKLTPEEIEAILLAQKELDAQRLYTAALQGVCANPQAAHDSADQAALYAFEAANAMLKLISEKKRINNPPRTDLN